MMMMLTSAKRARTESSGETEKIRLLRDNISSRTGRRLHNVEVSLVGDQVTVRGKAYSYYVRQLALASILNTMTGWGPMHVVDKIDVQKMPGAETALGTEE